MSAITTRDKNYLWRSNGAFFGQIRSTTESMLVFFFPQHLPIANPEFVHQNQATEAKYYCGVVQSLRENTLEVLVGNTQVSHQQQSSLWNPAAHWIPETSFYAHTPAVTNTCATQALTMTHSLYRFMCVLPIYLWVSSSLNWWLWFSTTTWNTGKAQPLWTKMTHLLMTLLFAPATCTSQSLKFLIAWSLSHNY